MSIDVTPLPGMFVPLLCTGSNALPSTWMTEPPALSTAWGAKSVMVVAAIGAYWTGT